MTLSATGSFEFLLDDEDNQQLEDFQQVEDAGELNEDFHQLGDVTSSTKMTMVCVICHIPQHTYDLISFLSHIIVSIFLGFDWNLPLDEYGAFDFDFVQNLAGKVECFLTVSTSHILHCWIEYSGFLQVEHVVEVSVEEQVEEPRRRKERSKELRKQDYKALLARSKNEKLGKKDIKIVAIQIDVHIWPVQLLWKRGQIQLANSIRVVISSLKKVELAVRQSLLIWKHCTTFL